MSLPLWDPIDVPPGYTLIDINGVEPDELKFSLQAEAVRLWMDETGDDPFQNPRPWSDEEGMFAIVDANDEIVGVTIIVDAV